MWKVLPCSCCARTQRGSQLTETPAAAASSTRITDRYERVLLKMKKSRALQRLRPPPFGLGRAFQARRDVGSDCAPRRGNHPES
jgi:hypothetical protein